jgi:murein DD-endopeptidase MepM/ murein hydrolase activator NlpD
VAAAATLWLGVDLALPSQAQTPPKAEASVGETAAASRELAVKSVSLEEIRLIINVTNKELQAATDQRDAANRDLDAATSATDELRGDADDLAQTTLRIAIAEYQKGQVPRDFQVSDDLTTNLRITTLGNAAVGSDTKSFDTYRNVAKDLEIEESELAGKADRLATAQLVLDTLTTELDTELALLGELEERELQNQAAQLSARASVRSQYKGRRQGYYLDTCPVNGPHNFINSWGFARSGGRRHQGVDVMAAIGTPVVAPVAGTVELADNSVGGKSFHLIGNDGNYFYGTHLSRYGKSGAVKVGEVIGYVGDDGNARGIPHLHFEIHPGGRARPAISPFVDTAAVCSGARY